MCDPEKLDSRIISAMENDFPLAQRPYRILAQRLKITEEALLERVRYFVDCGVIRRIGASIDSRAIGFCGTLAAVSVPPERVEGAAEIIGSFSEITHSYLRKDHFNIWFTVIAPNRERIEQILRQVREKLAPHCREVLDLPMARQFKLDARFARY